MGLLHSIIIGWFDLSLVHPLSYLFELGGLCLFLMHKALMGIRCRNSHSRLWCDPNFNRLWVNDLLFHCLHALLFLLAFDVNCWHCWEVL